MTSIQDMWRALETDPTNRDIGQALADKMEMDASESELTYAIRWLLARGLWPVAAPGGFGLQVPEHARLGRLSIFGRAYSGWSFEEVLRVFAAHLGSLRMVLAIALDQHQNDSSLLRPGAIPRTDPVGDMSYEDILDQMRRSQERTRHRDPWGPLRDAPVVRWEYPESRTPAWHYETYTSDQTSPKSP